MDACNLNRDWPSGRGIFHNDAKTFLVWVNEEDQLRIISMQPDKKSEVEYCQKLASTFDIPSSVQKVSTLNELVQQINLGSFVISQRYHGALVALALNTQVTIIPQRDEDKLSSLCQFEGDMHKFIHAGEACLRNALEN